MPPTSRVTLVAAPGALIAALRDLQVTTVNPADLNGDASRVATYLATTGSDVIVFGPDVAVELALGVAAELSRHYPEVDVVLIRPPSLELLADAMRAGIREILSPDTAGDVVGATVARVAEAASLRRNRLGATAGEGKGPGVGGGHGEGRLVAVMAAKGGVGKTTIAVNLAVELARTGRNEVVLVDLDLMAGDADLMLGLEAKATVASVASPGVLLDPTVLKLSLSPHPSGLLVLAAPEGLVEADGVEPDLLVEMLAMLRASFRHVVVDTAPGAGAPLAAAVEAADDVLAIATPDLGGLRSLRRNLDGLDQLGLDRAQRQLVLNRSDFRTGIGNQTIENTVELQVSHAIPDVREIAAAANQGMPFVSAHPKIDASRAVRDLATSVGGDRTAPAADNGRHSSTRHVGAA